MIQDTREADSRSCLDYQEELNGLDVRLFRRCEPYRCICRVTWNQPIAFYFASGPACIRHDIWMPVFQNEKYQDLAEYLLESKQFRKQSIRRDPPVNGVYIVISEHFHQSSECK